jgi:hypothetical protein
MLLPERASYRLIRLPHDQDQQRSRRRSPPRGLGGRSVTPLEIAQLIFELLTLVGLIGIAIGGVRKLRDPAGVQFYKAITFTAIASALWIIVSLLLQR